MAPIILSGTVHNWNRVCSSWTCLKFLSKKKKVKLVRVRGTLTAKYLYRHFYVSLSPIWRVQLFIPYIDGLLVLQIYSPKAAKLILQRIFFLKTYILNFYWHIVDLKVKVRVTPLCPTSCNPHGLYSPWNSPGQNTGVSSLCLLQEIFPNQGSNPGLPHCRRILYQLSHKTDLQCFVSFRCIAERLSYTHKFIYKELFYP